MDQNDLTQTDRKRSDMVDMVVFYVLVSTVQVRNYGSGQEITAKIVPKKKKRMDVSNMTLSFLFVYYGAKIFTAILNGSNMDDV